MRHVRVPLDPPRRACRSRGSSLFQPWPRCRPRRPSPVSVSAPSRSTFRRSGPAWAIRPRRGWRRRFPARSPSRSRPIWRPATATGRRWWRGSTISISDQAAAAAASAAFGVTQDTINGTLLLRGPRGVVANVPLRAISLLFPDGGRSDAGRAGLARPRDGACAGVCGMGAEGAGSLERLLRSAQIVAATLIAADAVQRASEDARPTGYGPRLQARRMAPGVR